MERCDRLPQISLTSQDNSIQPFLVDVHRLGLYNHPEPGEQDVCGKGFKPELGAARGQGFNDPAHVVTDQTELGAPTLLLHGSSRGRRILNKPNSIPFDF